MAFVQCNVFQCASSSGGKVWAVPNNTLSIPTTFSGTMQRYRQGSLTVNNLSVSKSRIALENEKRKKGYSWMQYAWIDTQSGVVSFTNPEDKSTAGLKRESVATEPLLPTIEVKSEGLFSF